MRRYGRGSIHDFLGDFILYRSLTPVDDRLPGYAKLAPGLSLDRGRVPRKNEPAYGTVVAHLLRLARQLDAPRIPIRRVLLVGDTRMNDGFAFESTCRAGGWPGAAFITSETSESARLDIEEAEGRSFVLSNRWATLREIEAIAQQIGVPVNEQTAVLFDLDKTAIGARGRNDGAIDRARVDAARQTVGSLLGSGFDAEAFETAYERLNRPDCHRFTSDNQDLLVYACLILGTGIFALEAALEEIVGGTLARFEDFLDQVDTLAPRLPEGVRDAHRQVSLRIRQGDPTPFVAFRRAEYQETVARMGAQPDATLAEELLAQEITLTAEVRDAAVRLRERGALLFGLSDKPEQACFPTAEQSANGYLPLHRMVTHVVGE